MSTTSLVATATLLVLNSAGAQAQQADLVTDRPGQTESAITVAPGQYQIETGLLISEHSVGHIKNTETEILGTLVRIGLTERVELRAGFNGFVSRKVEGPGFSIRDEGVADTSLGAKILLSESDGQRPQLALLVETSLATGESDVSTDDWEPSFLLAAARDLANGVGLGVNLGIAEEDGDSVAFYSVAAGNDINSTNGAFIEVFGNSDDEHSIDTGWTHLFGPTTQGDIAIGFGLSDEAPDWFVGIGLTLRFPN